MGHVTQNVLDFYTLGKHVMYSTSVKDNVNFFHFCTLEFFLGNIIGMKSFFGEKKDTHFMQQALVQARKALAFNEVPIGAVIVSPKGNIIARAYNKVEKTFSQLAHAECLVIQKATKKYKNWRLQGCWLYVTLQPCAMCMHVMRMSRLQGVVYAAESPLFGFHLDNIATLPVYQKDIFTVLKGVKQQEAAALLKQFFKKKRKEKSSGSKKAES